jgi:hypothetical protein
MVHPLIFSKQGRSQNANSLFNGKGRFQSREVRDEARNPNFETNPNVSNSKGLFTNEAIIIWTGIPSFHHPGFRLPPE